jgi:hypothetical protein
MPTRSGSFILSSGGERVSLTFHFHFPFHSYAVANTLT